MLFLNIMISAILCVKKCVFSLVISALIPTPEFLKGIDYVEFSTFASNTAFASFGNMTLL